MIAVALIVLAWLLSQVVKLALSRSRELLADAGSVELTKNPDAMISALRKIENRGELPGATSAVMEMCVDNPREGFADLFATHPSVDSRVQALVTVCRRPRSRPAGAALRRGREPATQAEPHRPPASAPPGPWSDAAPPATARRPAGRGAGTLIRGRSERPWGRHR